VTVGVVMVFPDGNVAGPRWAWLPKAFVVTVAASTAGVLTASDANVLHLGAWTNPMALPAQAQPVSGLLSLFAVALGVVTATCSVVAQCGRWRRGHLLERQQLLVLAVAASLPVLAAPVVLATGLGGWLLSAAAIPLPFAIGFVVLATDAYDLQTAANRFLVWATLSAGVVGLYALVIVGLGSRFNEQQAPWLPWLAAAAVAVAFAPMRNALQRAVNRLTYGRWDQPYDVLASLGQRLEASADVDLLLGDVLAELDALGLADVAVLTPSGEVIAGAVGGEPDVRLPMAAYGNPVGTLAFRAPRGQLRPADRRLVEDLAGHLAGVLHGRELTRDLQRALEQVVLAREEERRRLRRDLHDGLGPALAGHLLQLDVVTANARRGQPVDADLAAVQADLRATMDEVRRVVEGLRPPALDELGLVGAVGQTLDRLFAGSPVVASLHAEPLPSLPAAVEVAAYRIVSAAATNVARHSGATTCVVSIEHVGQALRVCVRDDGGRRTGPAVVAMSSTGNGLQTMRERAEELGGRLGVFSEDGTTVVAELPVTGPVGAPARDAAASP
jgi:signal transduction histidine kinase